MSNEHPDEKSKAGMVIKRRDLLLSSTSLLAASTLDIPPPSYPTRSMIPAVGI